MPPVKTIASKPAAGLKKNKTRITILFACNSTGTEKLDLFFIGNALQPRAFKKSTAAQLGIQYTANKKAWMTSSLFSSWLQRLDAYVQSKAVFSGTFGGRDGRNRHLQG